MSPEMLVGGLRRRRPSLHWVRLPPECQGTRKRPCHVLSSGAAPGRITPSTGQEAWSHKLPSLWRGGPSDQPFTQAGVPKISLRFLHAAAAISRDYPTLLDSARSGEIEASEDAPGSKRNGLEHGGSAINHRHSQDLPFTVSHPSRRMRGIRVKAATGSAQAIPHRVFATSPARAIQAM
jgi:hypothetical protein